MTDTKQKVPEIVREQVRITQSMIDDNGCVWVFMHSTKDWKKCSTIDAREIVGMGAGDFDGPDEGDPRSSQRKNETEPPSRETLERRLGAKPKAELRTLCEKHGVDFGPNDAKTVMIDALIAKGVAGFMEAGGPSARPKD